MLQKKLNLFIGSCLLASSAMAHHEPAQNAALISSETLIGLVSIAVLSLGAFSIYKLSNKNKGDA